MADLGQPALSLGRDAFPVRRNQLEATLSETSLWLRGATSWLTAHSRRVL